MTEVKDMEASDNQSQSDDNKDTSTHTKASEKSKSQHEQSVNDETDQENDELAVLKSELQEQKDKYLRLFAEFDNFKKRSAKERIELSKTAGQDVIREMLPVLDDFQRAAKALAADNNTENYANGVKLIQEKFQKTLQNKGLHKIDSIGHDFDVEKQEAIAEVPAPTPDLVGKVIDEVEAGYTLNDAIIRYAKVVVGK